MHSLLIKRFEIDIYRKHTVDGCEILHRLIDGAHPIIKRFSTSQGGAGFFPSTVCENTLMEPIGNNGGSFWQMTVNQRRLKLDETRTSQQWSPLLHDGSWG